MSEWKERLRGALPRLAVVAHDLTMVWLTWYGLHTFRYAILPVLTVMSLEFAFLLGGLVVTEQVFNLNGLGMLFVEAIARRDYTLTQALVMLVATFFLIVNFVVDIAYAWIDPRIRYR